MATEKSPHVAPELVGPPHAREDVSHHTDRAISVRLLHEFLTFRYVTEERFAKVFIDLGALLGRVHWVESGNLDPANDSSLPPMRRKFDSTHTIVEAAEQEIARRVDEETKNPSTPSPPMPEKVAEIGADVMRIAIDRVKSRMFDEKQSLEKKAGRARIRFFLALAIAVVATASHFFHH